MNQFFNSQRFSLLVSKHWAENKKRYGLSLLAFAGLLIACFVISLVLRDDDMMTEDFQQTVYFMSIIILGPFYASQFYRDLGSKPKGSNFLLVPASSFEKLLCGLLYVLILFFVAFNAIFYLLDGISLTIAKSFPVAPQHKQEMRIFNIFQSEIFNFSGQSKLKTIPLFFALQSVFLLGSAAFRKYNFMKTIICIFIVWVILFLLAYFLFHKQYPEGQEQEIPDSLAWLITIVAMYVIAPLLWVWTYYRVKNKQIAL